MQTYWLTDRQSGEAILVDRDTVERLLGIELGYVEWCIKVDEVFENGRWKIYGKVRMHGNGRLAQLFQMFFVLTLGNSV